MWNSMSREEAKRLGLEGIAYLITFIISNDIALGIVLSLILLWSVYNIGKALRGKN